MSEIKHTPGPWFVGAQNDALYIVAGRSPSLNNDYPVHNAKRVAVAKVYASADDDALQIYEDANARLIAAAPDMLAALHGVRQELWVNYCLTQGRTDIDPAPFNSKPHIRIIDAAIAKAEGR